MKFKDVQESFNFYRTKTLQEIETRAAAIKTEIQNNASADIEALNIEAGGLQEAKANLLEKEAGAGQTDPEKRSTWNPITGASFQDVVPTDGDIFGSREYRSAFHKFMLNQTLTADESAIMQRARQTLAAERRADFINTSEAAAAIPTAMLNEIFKEATAEGGVLAAVRRFNLPANVAVPVATPEDMADWHTEGQEVTPTSKTPANVIFKGYELMKVFSISAAARSMTITAFESYLQAELSRTMLTALQSAVINGTGTGQPKGLLAAGIITNTLLNQPLGYDAFAKALALLKRGYAAGAAWAMSNATLYSSVVGVMDGTGRPLFNNPNDGSVSRILGKPLIIDDFIPDGTVIVGNFQFYGMNFPQDILLEVSRDSSFRKGLIDYRALAVADGQPIIPDAFVKLTLDA
jgi:HK97 family phage major capsid protein